MSNTTWLSHAGQTGSFVVPGVTCARPTSASGALAGAAYGVEVDRFRAAFITTDPKAMGPHAWSPPTT